MKTPAAAKIPAGTQSLLGGRRREVFFILHPSSFILHPSSFILHPSSLILHPSSFIPPETPLLGLSRNKVKAERGELNR
jgi:hypothetical protein